MQENNPNDTLRTDALSIGRVSDRDCLTALMSAVLGLGEKLTGERMTVHLRTENGDEFEIRGSSMVTWTSLPPGAEIIEQGFSTEGPQSGSPTNPPDSGEAR